MYAEPAHSCVRTFEFLMEKYDGGAELELARRSQRPSWKISKEIAAQVISFVKRGGSRPAAARAYGVGIVSVRKLVNGHHPICRELEGAS